MRSLLKPGFVPTDNPMFPVEQGLFADPFAFASPGTCFGPLMAAPALMYGMMAVSAAMTVVGGLSSAASQAQQGQIAARNAQLRDQQMRAQAVQQENEAEQNRAAANNASAVGQREAIEARRKGRIMAGRAQTVMAASGAGVDGSMTAGLLAEGDYAGDVALYGGEDKARVLRNMGTVNDYNAASLRAGGEAGIWSAEQTKNAFNTAATSTALTSFGKAGMTLAQAYGGSSTGGGVDFSPVSGKITDSAAWNAMPNNWRNPGFDEQWGVS